MNDHGTSIVVLNAGYQVIGFLTLEDGQVHGEAVAEFALEFEVLIGQRARVLQLPEVGFDAQGNTSVSLVDVSPMDPRALEAVVETLRREGVLAHRVPTVLKNLLIRVNGIGETQVRQKLLSYLLYIPASEADSVVRNFTDLRVLADRLNSKK